MDTAALDYKLLKKIKDERFDVEDLHHYVLFLQIGVRDFQVCVVDSRSNQCLLLEDFILPEVSSSGEVVEVLSSLFESHHLLMAGFWKNVKVSVKNNQFSLLPAPLFLKEGLHDYLKLNAKVSLKEDELHYYKSIKSNVVTVFAVNKQLANWVRSLYPNSEVGFLHQSCSLIEGVLHHGEKYRSNQLYLYIDRFKLHVLSLKDKDLEYYNQFRIKQFSEYIRYIMLVMKGLSRSQAQSEVVIWGYIGRQSPHYNEFYKYIRNVSFGDRPGYLNYSYIFDEVQDHHFFDLYSMHLCD